MPTEVEPEMAFVLVQHLAPDHKSILTDLVQRYTRLHVEEVSDGIRVERNCAYIIPPNHDMALLGGTLHLFEPSSPRGLRLPIDFFFRSLAQDQGERAICIVLSGTGSDGTLGVRAVKGEGGIVLAQSPETTQYDGMPRSVIATGLVDLVLPPEKMLAQLLSYAKRSFGDKPRLATAPTPASESSLNKICVILRDRTGHDFSQYKRTTLARRVERRMTILQIERAEDYLRYVQQDKDEAEVLFKDLLIGVTNFFRDPEAFEALEKLTLPKLFTGKSEEETLRTWVCGCSTGEEAYSIAILLQEALEQSASPIRVQIFATDVDKEAIEHARAGVYPASITSDISQQRLAHFFEQLPGEGGYQIKKSIRDLIVFSEQDLIKDPPFSKLDLLCCRNLLIYLSGTMQKRIIPLFHYSLRPGGLLFLGISESIGEGLDLFAALDRRAKIFERQGGTMGAWLSSPSPSSSLLGAPSQPRGGPAELRRTNRPDLRAVTLAGLLEPFGTAAILIRENGEILHILGRTGKYLEAASGDAEMNILTMAREGLRSDLRRALRQSAARKETVRRSDIRVKTNGEHENVNLTVRPLAAGMRDNQVGTFIVTLEEAKEPPRGTVQGSTRSDGAEAEVDARVVELESELKVKEEDLQTTIEEMETTNEELHSSNEELQSVNEELQSTNEELETSKEELQSVNEELATVNAELQSKVTELSRSNLDMNYLLAGTGVGTLFVNHQLQISRFTPSTVKVINLIPGDVGRPVAHVVSNFVGYDRLVADIREVLSSLIPHEAELLSLEGLWYMMQIRPYRTSEHEIEGAVITFVDITARKKAEIELQDALIYSESIIATLREPFLVLDAELKVKSANNAFFRRFGVTPAETAGRALYELGNGQWNIPELRTLLEESLTADGGFDDYRVTHSFEGLGERTMVLNARRIRNESHGVDHILLAIDDIAESSA